MCAGPQPALPCALRHKHAAHCERARRPCALAAGLRPLLGGWFWTAMQAPSSTGGLRRVRGAETL